MTLTAITDEQIKACVVNGNRPSLDAIQGNDGLVSFTKKWIRLCWHESPDERPTFDSKRNHHRLLRY